VRGELKRAHRRLLAALSAWEGIRDHVRPAADEAMRQIGAGYRAGRLGYLEIQEGQRSLLEADLLLIEAAADVWRARSALERLAGDTPGAPTPEQENR
jgi:outer membrane protein TolC